MSYPAFFIFIYLYLNVFYSKTRPLLVDILHVKQIFNRKLKSSNP